MEDWDPWAVLRARPDITLGWAWLPDGHHGTVQPDGNGWRITLDARLNRVERRCTLAHELIHIERGIIEGPRLSMIREEAIVRAETAHRLVPLPELARTVTRMASVGLGVEAHHVASFYDVTHDVATDALRHLNQVNDRQQAA